MKTSKRWDQIVEAVNQNRYLSVNDLSELFKVSEMTIRRDLEQLAKLSRIQRIYGGAASTHNSSVQAADAKQSRPQIRPEDLVATRVDVLIAATHSSKYDLLTTDGTGKKRIPIIAESIPLPNADTCVSVDNYQAGVSIGKWAGEYASQHWNGRAKVLDLTYHFPNTHARSRGFLDGLRAVLPSAEELLTLNPDSRFQTSYQLTRDALAVHPQINIVFAINDTNAWGAIHACKELGLDPDSIIVVPFGLEGDTLMNALIEGKYCKAALAMFPEIVGRVCIEAAISASSRQRLPDQLVTPHAVLTRDTLTNFYTQDQGHWRIRWDAVQSLLPVPLPVHPSPDFSRKRLPKSVGFVVQFTQHEWYRNLAKSMREYAESLNIKFEEIDSEQSLKDELEFRRQKIARQAAMEIRPRDVILIDGGVISNHLAEEIKSLRDITVITNSLSVFDILKNSPEITLISTGGVFRRATQALVGPTAEGALSEMRADKLFLTVSGVSQNFGLSYTNLSEVTIKQTMIRTAREVILLADNTCFGQESTAQVAPLNAVHKLITDDALPASFRLDLSRQGIEVIVVNV